MTDRCPILVGEPPGYWHWHTCGRPVKVRLRATVDRDFGRGGPVAVGDRVGVCGVHARVYPYRSSDGQFARESETA